MKRPRCLYIFLILLLPCAWSPADAHPGHEHEDDHPHAAEAAERSITTTRTAAKVLPLAKEEDVFHFVIYGDRTGGPPEGLKVLEQAVVDTNLLDPDLVMTVGDLIQGYSETDQWLREMEEYKLVMKKLNMKWYPVAGNHDIYWRGKGKPPAGHHEQNYEKHFGPLWYSFRHKNAGFIVLYSDEGDPATNRKDFNEPALQQMSDAQLEFLDKALSELKDADHLFLFLHHPRWIGGRYGHNWQVVHEKLKAAGNVTAVFAGHIHRMKYDPQDGIEYFALATTGGHLSADIPGAGYLHHMNLVTVRKNRVSVSALPVGAVIDPKAFTEEFLAEIARARAIRPILKTSSLVLQNDGSGSGEVAFTINNNAPRPIDAMIVLDTPGGFGPWAATLDHRHVRLAPGTEQELKFRVRRTAGELSDTSIPSVRLLLEYVGESTRVRLPDASSPISVRAAPAAADYFAPTANRAVAINGEQSAVRVNAADVMLPQGPFTLEAWVRPQELDGFRAIIAKSQASEYAIFSDEGVPQFETHLGGRYVVAPAKHKLSENKWTHLAGVYDGATIKLFIDGKLAASETAEGKRRTNDLPLYIGADSDRNGQPTRTYSGQIDEVRLSRAAIYEDEFQPPRRLESNEATMLLLHFDKTAGPFVLSNGGEAFGQFGPQAALVDVAD